jgi:hypothetical protein
VVQEEKIKSQVDQEITLKEIVATTKEYFIEVFKKWYIVILFLIPSIVYFYYKHINHESKYAAETKFIVEGQSAGGVGGLLSQFGLSTGGGGKTNPYKVMEVAKSKLTIREILFKKLNDDFIANHILREYKLTEKWSEIRPEFKDFIFKSGNYQIFDTLQNSVLLALIGKVLGGKNDKEPILGFNYNEDTGIFTYSVKTKNEELSMTIIDECYSHLVGFFEEDLISSKGNTSKILKVKADSIKVLIESKSYQAAKIDDRSFGLIMSTPKVRKSLLEKEIAVLTAAYTELMRNYEVTDVTMKDSKSLFLILDKSLPPLEPSQSSLLINLLKGIILGGALSVTFIILAKIIREALR